MRLHSMAITLLFLVLTASAASYYVLPGGITAQAAEEKVFDPACGMQIDKASALSSEYEGKTYYFCSKMCKANFDKDPGKMACACKAGCECPHCQAKAAKCGCKAEAGGHKH